MTVIDSGRVLSISHIQINCRDLGRSVAFYKRLDFKIERIIGDNPAQPADPDNLDTVPAIHSEMGASRTVGMCLSDDPRATTRIELMEWEPARTPIDVPPMERLAVARIALTVKGLEDIAARLEAAGDQVESMETFDISSSLSSRFAHIFDPDGNQLTLMEWLQR